METSNNNNGRKAQVAAYNAQLAASKRAVARINGDSDLELSDWGLVASSTASGVLKLEVTCFTEDELRAAAQAVIALRNW